MKQRKMQDQSKVEIIQPEGSITVKKEGHSLKFVSSILTGLFFGIAMNKGRVAIPSVIVNQMRMTDFTMMKMFLSALLTSLIVTGILYESKSDFSDKCRCHIPKRARGYPSTLLGGILIGIGMVLSGSCPGTVYPQMGANLNAGIYVFAGALLGTLVYGLADSSLKSFIAWGNNWGSSSSLDELLHTRFSVVTSGLSAFLVVVLVILEYLTPGVPFITYADGETNFWFFNAVSIHPLACGVMIGANQILLMLIQSKGLGNSSSYVPMVAAISYFPFKILNIKSNYLTSSLFDVGSYLNIFFVAASTLGAFVSASLSNTVGYNHEPSSDRLFVAFIGGFIALVGARLANGCTSGHGLTGCAFLSLNSFVATAGMFGGGILLAVSTGSTFSFSSTA